MWLVGWFTGVGARAALVIIAAEGAVALALVLARWQLLHLEVRSEPIPARR